MNISKSLIPFLLSSLLLVACGGGGGGSNTSPGQPNNNPDPQAQEVELEGVWEFSAPDCVDATSNFWVSITTSPDGTFNIYGFLSDAQLTRDGNTLTISGDISIMLGLLSLNLNQLTLTFDGTDISATISTNSCTDTPITATRIESDTAPLAPTNERAVQRINSIVQLYWTDNADNETGYIIRRMGPGENSYSEVVRLGRDSQGYYDRDIAYSTEYFYEVVAYNDLGESAAVTMQITTAAATPPPSAPVDLIAGAFSGSIGLRWTDTADDEDSYVIYYCVASDCTATQNSVIRPLDSTRYLLTGLQFETAYLVHVCASHAVNGEGCSAQMPVTTLAEYIPLPAAPTNVVAQASATGIVVTWTDNATNETEYTIDVCEGTGCIPANGTRYNTNFANYQIYRVTNLNEDTDYSVHVCAVNVTGSSCATSTVSTHTGIAAPSNLGYLRTEILPGAYVVTLTWHDNSSIETGYQVEMSVDGTFTDREPVLTEANVTSHRYPFLVLSGYFRVKTITATGESDYSPVYIVTLP